MTRPDLAVVWPPNASPASDRTPAKGIYHAAQSPRWVKAIGDHAGNRGGYLYDLVFNGEIIVKGSKAPIYDLCRALQARGLKGTAVTVDQTGIARMSCDIDKGALLTVVDDDVEGLRIVRWRPFDGEAKARISRTVSSPAAVPDAPGIETPEMPDALLLAAQEASE